MTQAQAFDGDGVRTRLSSQQVTHNQNGTTTTETKTQYFVTSSVIGGVVTELTESGQKERTFVYQGSQILAWQQNGSTQTVAWEHRDISNASVRGAAVAELEPLGMNAGLMNPFPRTSTRPPLTQARTYPGFADMTSSQCKIDFVDAPCGLAESLLRGAGQQCPPSGCRSVNLSTNRTEDFHASADGHSGYMPAGATYVGEGKFRYPGRGDQPYGRLSHRPQESPQQTVSLSKAEINHLRDDLQNLLKNEKCKEIIKAILEKLGANTGVKAHSANLMDIFERIRSFSYRSGPFSARVGGNAGMNNIDVDINYPLLDSPSSRITSGETLIHEMTHAAPGSGRGSYWHYQMDQAAWDVAKDRGLTRIGLSPIRERPEFTPTSKKHDTDTSPFFNNMIFYYCGKGVKR